MIKLFLDHFNFFRVWQNLTFIIHSQKWAFLVTIVFGQTGLYFSFIQRKKGLEWWCSGWALLFPSFIFYCLVVLDIFLFFCVLFLMSIWPSKMGLRAFFVGAGEVVRAGRGRWSNVLVQENLPPRANEAFGLGLLQIEHSAVIGVH